MRVRALVLIGLAVLITAGVALIRPLSVRVLGQTAAAPAAASAANTTAVPRTPWGEPDLQGIWTNEFDTPLQRPTRYGTREFLTEAERQALDEERAALLGRDRRVERGTELDVAGA